MNRGAITGLLLFLGIGVAYALTRAHSWTWDSVSYAWNAERGTLSAVHQHHLLHEPVLHAFYRICRRSGVHCRALDVGQWMGICAAGLGAALYCSLLARVLRSRFWALIFTLALAFSYAYWHWATQAEVYPFSFLALLLVFRCLLDYGDRPSAARAAVAGVCAALAILLQQANALMAITGLYAIAVGARGRGRPAGGHAVIFITCALAPAAVVYWAWARFVAEKTAVSSQIHWSLGGAASGIGGGGQWSPAKLPLVAVSLGKSIANGGSLNQARVAPLAALLGIAAAVCAVAALPRARARAPLAAGVCAIWAGLYGIFAGWWYTDLLKFWIAVLPPVYCIIALGAAAIEERLRLAPLRLLLRGGAFIAVIALYAVNLITDILPAHDRTANVPLAAAHTIAQATHDNDLLVVSSGMVKQYLQYFYHRPYSYWIYEIFQQLDKKGFNDEAEKVRRRMAQARIAGSTVYLCPDAWDPDMRLITAMRIPRQLFVAFWAPYRSGAERAISYQVERRGGRTTYYLYRLSGRVPVL